MKRPSVLHNVHIVLHATVTVVEEQGGVFISSKKATETGKLATTHYVLEKLHSAIDPKDLRNEANEELVSAIITHFKNIDVNPLNPDDFILKVKDLLSTNLVSERMIGFIVALPHLYKMKVDRTKSLVSIADKYASSNYIGEIGKREEFFVKLILVQDFTKTDTNGAEQNLRIYKVADQLGNFGYFFAKAGSLADENGQPIVDVFDCFLMKATPKKHGVGKNGIKETQFSRVRIIQNVGKGSEE